MKCKLCLEEKPLCKNSHIVSDYLFDNVYDEKNRMVEIIIKNKSITHHPVQTSHKESDILCSDCDGVKICRLEGYTKSKLFIPLIEYSKNLPPPEQNISKVFTVDSQRIKLFFLSLLWKMSITKNPEYRSVYLGKKHEEIIRKMIDENNPKEVYDYPFILHSLINKNNYCDSKSYIRTYHSPRPKRMDNGYEYVMQLPGFLLDIRVSKLTKLKHVEFSNIDKDKIRVIFPTEQNAKYCANKMFGIKVF